MKDEGNGNGNGDSPPRHREHRGTETAENCNGREIKGTSTAGKIGNGNGDGEEF